MKKITKAKFKTLLRSYDYSLPKELIAESPAKPRDSARILVYERESGRVAIDRFSNIDRFLPKKAVIVCNETRVIPARLTLRKETGGKVRVLYLGEYAGCVRVLSDRNLTVGSKVWFTSQYFFLVQGKEGSQYFLLPSFSMKKFFELLDKYGKTPLPPYIKNNKDKESVLRKKYQSVFSKERGSVAAPTASLHFTKRLIKKLKKKGFGVAFVTLHVGLGTFAPVTFFQFFRKRLHEEYFSIDGNTLRFLRECKREGRPIIAVGTTVLRTLESASPRKGRIVDSKGVTSLFIQQGYRFKFVDGLITNFHVPRSSLLMLVSAFMGKERMFGVYKKAIQEKFRFFSFGDGMLIT